MKLLSHTVRLVGVALAVAGGCSASRETPPEDRPRPQPVLAQQRELYPEARSGTFLSLIDFEDEPAQRGFQQLRQLSVRPAGGGQVSYIATNTRSGAGAARVLLQGGAELIVKPAVSNFRRHALLSAAVFSGSIRDDLRVRLTSDGGLWTSPPILLKEGWNTVLVDLQRLRGAKGFDISAVRAVHLAFADAGPPARFDLDDVLLIDNARRIEPTPAGVTLRKEGLDYKLELAGWDRPLAIAQGDDGLWRLMPLQPALCLARTDEPTGPSGERLEAMGPRRYGRVELLEANAVRLRLANTWHFPHDARELVDGCGRQVRWEHTFYGDGRCVTSLHLNNSGGEPIDVIRLELPLEAAVAGKGLCRELEVRGFAGPVGDWSWLNAPPGRIAGVMHANYLQPPAIEADATDGAGCCFDESEGCYRLTAAGGHCRLVLRPPPEGLLNPVFRVRGRWAGAISVACEGLPIRPMEDLGDSILFGLGGNVDRTTVVEITGRLKQLGQ